MKLWTETMRIMWTPTQMGIIILAAKGVNICKVMEFMTSQIKIYSTEAILNRVKCMEQEHWFVSQLELWPNSKSFMKANGWMAGNKASERIFTTTTNITKEIGSTTWKRAEDYINSLKDSTMEIGRTIWNMEMEGSLWPTGQR